MKREDIDLQWEITTYPNGMTSCSTSDIYYMNVSEASERLGKVYKGVFETMKDGVTITKDELLMVVNCDEETTQRMYRIPLNTLSVRIMCPLGAKFKKDDKGRLLYDMIASINSIDDSYFGIRFNELPFNKLLYIRKSILEYTGGLFAINGENFLDFCELIGGEDKFYN